MTDTNDRILTSAEVATTDDVATLRASHEAMRTQFAEHLAAIEVDTQAGAAQVEALRAVADDAVEVAQRAEYRIAVLYPALARARKALAFYADASLYEHRSAEPPHVLGDRGGVATRALEATDEGAGAKLEGAKHVTINGGPGNFYERDYRAWEVFVALQRTEQGWVTTDAGMAEAAFKAVDAFNAVRSKEEKTVPGKEEVLPPVTVNETIDLLSLANFDASLVTVTGWTQEQREIAASWAAAIHVNASDNPDVAIPPMPLHVATLGRVKR